MLFNNNAKDLISRQIFDLRQKGKMEWLARRDKALDYYAGDVEDFTKGYFGADMHSKIAFINNNITKRVIDRVSLVYSTPTLRSVDDETYSEVTVNKNRDLMHAERMTNLLNLVVLRLAWRGGKFSYDTITDFELGMHATLKNEITAISFPIGAPSSVLGDSDDIWEQWSAETIITFNNGTGKIIKEEENVLGFLPFIVVKNQEGRFSFTDIEPASDLVSVNEAINKWTADMDANIHFQSFDKTIVIGVPPNEYGSAPEIPVGPDKTTVIAGVDSGEVSVQVHSHSDSTVAITAAIVAQYRLVATNYHLSAAFVEGNAQAESGVALRTRNQELNDTRKESIILWRTVENKLYELEKQFLVTFFGKVLPDDFSVDFKEQEVILSQAEAEAQNNFDLEHGIVTVAQLLQRRDPDKFETLQEYQAFIDENKRINAGADSVSLNNILQS